jgi:MFS family permease
MPYRSLFAATEKMASPLILGYIGAAMSLGMMIGALPFGRLADRIGRKNAMFIVKPFYYASVVMFILAPFPEFLILSSFLRGLGMAMGFLWTVAYMEMVPKNQRATWNSLIMLVTRISRIPSPIIGGLLYNEVFPTVPFWTQLAIDAGFCIPLYALAIPETLKKKSN